jgi:predicted  nucleic acid-binding Zn-ribbon protein
LESTHDRIEKESFMSDQQFDASSQDVERIRDIIFGTQMRDYQQQFDALQRDLARLQQDLDQLNEQLAEQDSGQGKKLQALRRELRQADDDVRAELRETAQRLTADKVERVDLGRLFLEIGTHLTEGRSVSDLLKNLVKGEQDSAHEG